MKQKKEILLKQKRLLARIRRDREQIENNSLHAEASERKMGVKKEQTRKLKCRLEREEKRQKRVVVDARQVAAEQHTYDGSRRADEVGTLSCKEGSVVACSKRSKSEAVTEDMSHQESGNAAATAPGKKCPSDDVGPSQVGFAGDSPSEAKDAGEEGSKDNLGRKNAPSGRESRRTRETGEYGITANDRSNDRETLLSRLDLGSTSISKPVRSFMTLFEDEELSQTAAGDAVGGCLTQRVGLDFPTPKSKASEWEKKRKPTIESQNSDKRAARVKWTQALEGVERGRARPAEDTMETQSRRKVFGSTSKRNKATSRSQNKQGRSSFSNNAVRQSKVREMSDPIPPPKLHARHLPRNIEGDFVCVRGEPPLSTRASCKPPGAVRVIKSRSYGPEQRLRSETPVKLSNQRASLQTITNLSSEISWRSSTPLLDEAKAPLKRPFDVNSKVSGISTVETSTDRDRSGSKRSKVTQSSVENPTARERSGSKRNAIAKSHAIHHSTSSSQTRHSSSHDVQSSGISSGERGMSKSRRRKGCTSAVASGTLSVKAVPARLDDFSFSF
jgi:hypothetical protein